MDDGEEKVRGATNRAEGGVRGTRGRRLTLLLVEGVCVRIDADRKNPILVQLQGGRKR